jgi:hypothetical protein
VSVYNHQHRFYCGIDLHARTLFLHMLDHTGKPAPPGEQHQPPHGTEMILRRTNERKPKTKTAPKVKKRFGQSELVPIAATWAV